ncbi:hypothetical protein GTQ43_37275 [Nostoc sp. KVJ3]|nr:hypothetical protein [Nostoc sp. KVJ3]
MHNPSFWKRVFCPKLVFATQSKQLPPALDDRSNSHYENDYSLREQCDFVRSGQKQAIAKNYI